MNVAHFNFDQPKFAPNHVDDIYTSMNNNGAYAIPLLSAYLTVLFCRNMYNGVDAYAKFYADISKVNKQFIKSNLDESDRVESNTWFSQKNSKAILIPYGNLYLNRLKSFTLLFAEAGLTTAAQFEPRLFPIAASLEIYTVGNAFYYLGNSAYNFFSTSKDKEKEIASDKQNEQNPDWLLSGVTAMAADNIIHLVTSPFVFLVDLYAVKLAVQSWYSEKSPTIEAQEKEDITLEIAKATPLLFAEPKYIDAKLTELADSKDSPEVVMDEAQETVHAKLSAPTI